ncbi:MAG: caspase family protein [Saprospiraceae bacterium]|nr:caspase family protein [Saprospiraceae bacterium]
MISFDLAAQGNGTLHLITCIDVINSDISQGCSKDYQNATELFKVVADMGGMNYRPVNLQFDKDEVETFVDNFRCGPNDIVVFLYSGHGFQYDNDGDLWPWPFMFYCNREEVDIYNDACELDLEEVYDQPTSWKNILEQTKRSVNERNSNQTPQYRIE